MAYFYKSERDAIVRTIEYQTQEIPVRCNSSGVFYVELKTPLLLIKNRVIKQLEAAVKAEIDARGAGISIPFLRVRCSDAYSEVEMDEYTVDRIERGNVSFTNNRGMRCSVHTQYNNEEFLTVLDAASRAELLRLHTAVIDAIQARYEWMDARRFNYQDALELQKEGKYPREHERPEPFLESESEPDAEE